jgi:hypothetical protein
MSRNPERGGLNSFWVVVPVLLFFQKFLIDRVPSFQYLEFSTFTGLEATKTKAENLYLSFEPS